MNQTRDPSQKRLFQACWIMFIALTVALVAAGLQLNEIQEEFDVLTQNELLLNRLGGRVVHLDEVLTMSTHMAASTGDIAWETRFFENVSRLDSVLDQVHQLAPHIYESEANRITESANLELVQMEMSAFDSVRKGKLGEAKAILNSQKYQDQKRIYSDGISHLMFGIDQSVQSKLKRFHTLVNGLFITVLFILICLASVWLVVSRIESTG